VGRIPHVARRADTKGRQQPANKPSKPPKPAKPKQATDKKKPVATADAVEALVAAWDRAGPLQRREFVRERRIQVLRTQNENGGIDDAAATGKTSAAAATPADIGVTSEGELARLAARSRELEHWKGQLETKVIGLQAELAQLKERNRELERAKGQLQDKVAALQRALREQSFAQGSQPVERKH
jgi:hypothetical protein